MKRCWPLILCLLLAACAGTATQPARTEKPVEVTAPPTPAGTLAAAQPGNLGEPLTSIRPDGLCSTAEMKLLAPMVLENDSPRRMQLNLIDLTNGLPSCRFDPLSLELNNQLAVSLDGNHLAVITAKSDNFYGGKLVLVDLASQKVYPTTVKVDSWVSNMVFGPDGSHLALAYPKETTGLPVPGETPSTLLVAGFGDQGKVVERTLPFSIRLLRFTRDGSALVVYGAPDTSPDGDYPAASVALLAASDLSTVWEHNLEQVQHGSIPMEGVSGVDYLTQYLEPAVVYAPEQNFLYVVHASEEKLTQVDFNNRQIRTLDIRPELSWVERLLAIFAEPAQAKAASGTRKQAVLSPGGNKLYVVATRDDVKIDKDGKITPQREPLGLQVLDPASGEELDHIGTTADEIHISPDGAQLFLTTWGWGEVDGKVEVISTRGMNVAATLDHSPGQTFLITLSPTGKPHPLLLSYGSNSTEFSLVDWDSLELVDRWKVNGFPVLVSER